jgi:hypothetical protein
MRELCKRFDSLRRNILTASVETSSRLKGLDVKFNLRGLFRRRFCCDANIRSRLERHRKP